MSVRKKGFAALTPERVREIAAMGGAAVKAEDRAFSRDPELAKRAGAKGGAASWGPHREGRR